MNTQSEIDLTPCSDKEFLKKFGDTTEFVLGEAKLYNLGEESMAPTMNYESVSKFINNDLIQNKINDLMLNLDRLNVDCVINKTQMCDQLNHSLSQVDIRQLQLLKNILLKYELALGKLVKYIVYTYDTALIQCGNNSELVNNPKIKELREIMVQLKKILQNVGALSNSDDQLNNKCNLLINMINERENVFTDITEPFSMNSSFLGFNMQTWLIIILVCIIIYYLYNNQTNSNKYY
jgi:hypothetical protein